MSSARRKVRRAPAAKPARCVRCVRCGSAALRFTASVKGDDVRLIARCPHCGEVHEGKAAEKAAAAMALRFEVIEEFGEQEKWRRE